MTDRLTALRVLTHLAETPIGDTAVLVGSSGLFGFDTRVPALTEDVDVAVPESLVAANGPVIVEALARRGFMHEPGTASFTGESGVLFDLLAALLREVEAVRIDDLLASAQEACIALGRDPRFTDAGAEGYSTELEHVESGFEILKRVLETLHG